MKFLKRVFLFLVATNLLIYVNRTHFEYRPLAHYDQLYGANPGNWEKALADYPEREVLPVRRIVDSLTAGAATQEEKLIRIGRFLYGLFGRRLGDPNSPGEDMGPASFFQLLTRDSTRKVWCGDMARLFNWFAHCAGFRSRIIEIIQPGDHHMVNEVYLHSAGKWVLVDLTNAILMAGHGADMFNLLEIRQAVLAGRSLPVIRYVPNGFLKDKLKPEEPVSVRYYRSLSPLYYYQRERLLAVYSGFEKLKRYIWPTTWYLVYDPRAKPNALVYVKLVFFWSTIVWGLFMLAGIVRRGMLAKE